MGRAHRSGRSARARARVLQDAATGTQPAARLVGRLAAEFGDLVLPGLPGARDHVIDVACRLPAEFLLNPVAGADDSRGVAGPPGLEVGLELDAGVALHRIHDLAHADTLTAPDVVDPLAVE